MSSKVNWNRTDLINSTHAILSAHIFLISLEDIGMTEGVKVFTALDIELAQKTTDIVNNQRYGNRPEFETLTLGWDRKTGAVAVNYTFAEEQQVNDQTI
jgi:membrane peptidoglycan carboxypeptidase